MKTINSLSGGKTSSYLAVNYPADYNIFSLVRIEDKKCTPKDLKLVQLISDKIGMEFIATAESDLTLKAVLDLEQLIQKEIIWVTGNTFEVVNRKATGGKGLPNQAWRFCTTEMKMRPIFDWWFKNIGEKVKMGIGFRYDEMERAERLSTSFKGIVGKSKTGNRNKWNDIEWRQGYFPLIEDKIIQIGTTTRIFGEKYCNIRHIVTLKKCNNIPDIKNKSNELIRNEARSSSPRLGRLARSLALGPKNYYAHIP